MKKTTIASLAAVATVGVVANPFIAQTVQAESTLPSVENGEKVQGTAQKELTLEELKANAKQAEDKANEAKINYDQLDNLVKEKEADLSSATISSKEAVETLALAEARQSTIDRELNEAETSLDAAKKSLIVEVEKHPELASQLEEAKQGKEAAVVTQNALEKELIKVKEEKENSTKELTLKTNEKESVEAAIAVAKAEVERVKAEKVTATDALLAAQEQHKIATERVANEVSRLEAAVAAAGQDTVLSTRKVTVATVDGSAKVEIHKSPKHERVLYSGERTVEKEVTPEQLREYKEKGYFSYTPNAEAVSRHMVTLLRELRQLNGITLPVPEVSQAALDYAAKRANEMDTNKKLSHDTKLDTSNHNMENAALLDGAKTSDGRLPILSDEQMAYSLLNEYFADYRNLYTGSGDILYGHRIALLTGSGDGLGNGFSGRYHAMNFMDYSKVTDTAEFSRELWDVLTKFTYGKDSENTMYYNGKRLMFLPRTTFTYVTTVTETSSNKKKDTAVRELSNYRTASTALLNDMSTKVRQASQAVNQTTEAVANLEKQVSGLEQQGKRLEAIIVAARTTLAAVTQTEADLLMKVEASKRQTATKEERLNHLLGQSTSLLAAGKAVEQLETRLAELRAIQADLIATISQSTARKETGDKRIVQLTSELPALLNQREEAKHRYEQATKEFAAANKLLASKEAQTILSPFFQSHVEKEKGEQKVLSASKPVSRTISAKSTKQEQRLQDAAKVELTGTKTYRNTQSGTKTLPATGDQSNAFLMGLGFLLPLTALAKVRRENN